jgi:hypothetical protein
MDGRGNGYTSRVLLCVKLRDVWRKREREVERESCVSLCIRLLRRSRAPSRGGWQVGAGRRATWRRLRHALYTSYA